MKSFSGVHKLKDKKIRGKYLLLSVVVLANAFIALIQVPTALAAPTFGAKSLTATYKNPGAVTVAGGALWYLESSSSAGSSDYIGKMTTAGATTDYSIGLPPLQTSLTVSKLITGPDGNVWFTGSSSGGGVYVGKLDISTGAVTFYAGGSAYSAGAIAAGSDGKIYYTYQTSGSPSNSYLKSLDPSTGTITTVQTYDTYSNLGVMATGPDGRLYVGDGYYKLIYGISLTGGTNNTISMSTTIADIASGSDGNLWVASGSTIERVTTAGSITTFTPPTGVHAIKLVAGPDGAMWFVDDNPTSPKIGRITITAGAVNMYTIPGTSVSYEVGGPVLGPDNSIWFSYRNSTGNYLGNITTAPTFSNNPLTATYTKPGAMTVAGGDFWYFESSSGASSSNYIGRMTATGSITNYSIGYPPSQTSFTVSKLITGPDGNLWFNGNAGTGIYI